MDDQHKKNNFGTSRNNLRFSSDSSSRVNPLYLLYQNPNMLSNDNIQSSIKKNQEKKETNTNNQNNLFFKS